MMATRLTPALLCALMGWMAGAAIPRVALAGAPRFARLGSLDGPIEVQLDAADAWKPATPNLPLTESTRIRTAAAAKLEIEFDDTSTFRMAGEGLAELSDYTRLSGGQRITVISLDRGVAYFTGEPGENTAIHLLVPGAQVALREGSRIRLRALEDSSEIAVIEGSIRFTMPSAQMELHHGQSVRVTVPSSSHFSLFREIAPLETDAWSEQLDKAEAEAPLSRLDLDRAGKWIADGDYGTIWQPAPEAGWAPFRKGHWIWFQSVGFTWVADESWGWKPYHEGRWLQHKNLGWVWVPEKSETTDPVFLPGEVFWARSKDNVVLWGALAPGEQWNGTGAPRQFAALNATGGTLVPAAREIIPSSPEDLPKDLLKAFVFTTALPSPPLPASRLNVARPPLRTRLFTAVQVQPDVPPARPVTKAEPPKPEEPALVAELTPPPSPVVTDPAPADVVVADSPPPPVVPGIIAITRPSDRSRHSSGKNDSAKNAPANTTYVAAIPPPGAPLRAAGSSTAALLYERWFQEFKGTQITYQPAGAGAVIRQLKDGTADLAASDMPLSEAQMGALSAPLHFPAAISAVVPIYNLPGITDGLKLTPELLAGIYLGDIRYWNDPRILANNPRLTLPASDIILVHRSDGSATTLIWTDYLSKISTVWKNKVGAGASIVFPVPGLAARGEAGVATLVQQTPFSLAYVVYEWAKQNRIPSASLLNRGGRYVTADASTLTAAAAAMAHDMNSDFRTSITDAPARDAYPVAAFTYLLAPRRIDDQRKRYSIAGFLNWMLADAQKQVAEFGFAPLPAEIIAREKRQVSLIKGQ